MKIQLRLSVGSLSHQQYTITQSLFHFKHTLRMYKLQSPILSGKLFHQLISYNYLIHTNCWQVNDDIKPCG